MIDKFYEYIPNIPYFDKISYVLSGITAGLALEYSSRLVGLQLFKDHQSFGRPLALTIPSITGILIYKAGNEIVDYIESLEGYKYYISVSAIIGFIAGGVAGATIGISSGLSTPIEYFAISPLNIATSLILTSIIGFGAASPWATIVGAGIGASGTICYNYPVVSSMTIGGVIVGTIIGHPWLGGAIGAAAAATYEHYKDSIILAGENNSVTEDIDL